MYLKLSNKGKEKYFCKGILKVHLTRFEIKKIKKKYKNLRKAKILSKLPLEQWTKKELIDLIEVYSEYIFWVSGFNRYKIKTLDNYIYQGLYEKHSLYEEFRKNN